MPASFTGPVEFSNPAQTPAQCWRTAKEAGGAVSPPLQVGYSRDLSAWGMLLLSFFSLLASY